MRTIRFKNDTRLRKQLWVPGAMAHPAKGHAGMWQQIIENYTHEGDTTLDPMAGIGTSLVAALMGRNVICVELESHFLEPMKASWEKMRQQPMLGFEMGQVEIFQGDARNLGDVLVDSVISSPPYENAIPQGDDGIDWTKSKQGDMSHLASRKPNASGRARGYTRQVDSVVTSPPWQEVTHNTKDTASFPDATKKGLSAADYDPDKPPYDHRGHGVGVMERANTYNIGNLRSGVYWEAMKAVYSECYRVLKPGGIMALVLKGFTRDGKYVNLPAETASLVSDLGFTLFDHWRRELWTLSFWRILQQRRDPEAFDDRLRYEEVLAFRKGEGDGLVEAVITSPPYEGSDVNPGNVGNAIRKRWAQGDKTTDHSVDGYTRQVSAVITSPPYEGSMQGDEPSGKLFDTERRMNSPASGNRKSLRKPMGQGYTRRKPPGDGNDGS